MKKVLIILLAVLSVFTLVGCQNKQEEISDKPIEEGPQEIAGGYTLTLEDEYEIDETVKQALDKAQEGLTGASYSPICILASQVVSGTNYKILCKENIVSASPNQELAIVTLYVDLQGNAKINDVRKYDIVNQEEVEPENFDGLLGSYKVYEDYVDNCDDETKQLVQKTLEGLTGISYEPICKLASQVVAGTNSIILAQANRIESGNVRKFYCLLYIYEDLNSNCELNKMVPINVVE